MQLQVAHKQIRDIVERVTAAETQNAFQVFIAFLRHGVYIARSPRLLKLGLLLHIIAKVSPESTRDVSIKRGAYPIL